MWENQGQSAGRSRWRVFAAALIIAAGACLVGAVEFIGVSNQSATQRDFIEYWAVGRQLVHHASPYDVPAMVRLEEQAGLGTDPPRISLSPPTAFFLMLPLGLVSPRVGCMGWSLALIGCLSIAIWLLWRLNGRPDSRLHLFGYVFAPALACLMAGQISIFLLLGVVGFLCLHRSHPMAAGAALLPCALKPHLFLVFAAALLVWLVYRRAFRVLYGFVAALVASSALTLIFDPDAWRQYAGMMDETRILQMFIPTFGVALRFLVDRNELALQFMPLAIGLGWAIWYFWTRRDGWSWNREGLILLLVSEMCSPYGFFNDECILLPLVLAGLYRAARLNRSMLPLVLINAIAYLEAYFQVDIFHSPWYLWTGPAWLAWYYYAGRETATSPVEITAAQSGMASLPE